MSFFVSDRQYIVIFKFKCGSFTCILYHTKKNLAWSVLSQGDWLLRVPCTVCQSMQVTRLRERIRPIYRLYEGSHIDTGVCKVQNSCWHRFGARGFRSVCVNSLFGTKIASFNQHKMTELFYPLCFKLKQF